jgi:YHS domain-containing protein
VAPDFATRTNLSPNQEIIMTRIFNTSAVAAALLFGFATTAFAAAHGEFDNMCAEGLALHKEIKTDCSVNAPVNGKTYCFGNEQAKTDFMKDPSGNLAKAQSYYSTKRPG